jgi:hypothetical protein
MQQNLFKRYLSAVYLILVPFLAAILGFGVGHISYKIYLPVWIINVCLMVLAAWVLSGQLKNDDAEKKDVIAISLFLIAPWIFISIFFGMGPPPSTAWEYAAAATEQQVRYAILVMSGMFIALGCALLRQRLKEAGENFYSLIGFTAIMIAIPLFILNMIFWGSYLVEAFRSFSNAPSEKRPDWYLPVRSLFSSISLVEVALIYLATAAFAASLKVAKWFKPGACFIYIAISLLGMVLDILPSVLPESFAAVGFFVSIPAIPFIMPYFFGVNLLLRINSNKADPTNY